MPASLYFDSASLRDGRFEAGGIERYPFELINRSHLRECSVFGQGRLLPVLAIDPCNRVEEQVEALSEWEGCYFGFKLHTRATNCCASRLIGSPFIDLAARANIPIIIHTKPVPDFTHARHVVQVAKAHPEVRFSIAHAADFDRTIVAHVAALPNLFFDSSPFLSLCAEYRSQPLTERSQRLPIDFGDPNTGLQSLWRAAPDKLLWGSDEPWTAICSADGTALSSFSYEDEYSLVMSLPEDCRSRIGWSNPLRFLLGDNALEVSIAAAISTKLERLAKLIGSGSRNAD
ncbi:amidohydrolase family protein [Tropicibacter oceani]|uniref:Amidohydrolase family protein n=2 Tax=Tropicibacter oceani TaxID=3058420 RepID=A0ABY8QHX5_9RHOB|nr:amidohydrolase family protein [Tropicibacter oceani]WGW03578.1 amidohydrolase family protein [Tropicibacter oceani]